MLCIATIVSANYLAYAKSLFDSIRRFQPDAQFRVLIVDRATSVVRDAVHESKLNVTYVEELGLTEFEKIAFKYNILELNTALKPTFLKFLFEDGFEQVLYFDSDIRVFNPLVPIKEALRSASIVLTPHSLVPILDGYRPSDIDFLRSGTFNLGFIGLKRSAAAKAMLDWWEQRCLTYGFNDPGFGTFCDQKWMDLVPCYFDEVAIVKSPGCNVAYWNLHERDLALQNGVPRVNGEPLYFFHFSGVVAECPGKLSKYQNRHEIYDGSVVGQLVSDYCAELIENGHSRFSEIPYTFGSFDDGLKINPNIRRIVTFIRTERSSPFSAQGGFRKHLDKLGLLRDEASMGRATTTLNFNQDSAKVIWTNKLLRFAASFIGINRAVDLIRYMVVMGREGNLLRVIAREPFDFSHHLEKPGDFTEAKKYSKD